MEPELDLEQYLEDSELWRPDQFYTLPATTNTQSPRQSKIEALLALHSVVKVEPPVPSSDSDEELFQSDPEDESKSQGTPEDALIVENTTSSSSGSPLADFVDRNFPCIGKKARTKAAWQIVEYNVGRSYQEWEEDYLHLEGKSFFTWKGIAYPSSYFLAEFREHYKAQKLLFKNRVAGYRIDWSIFGKTLLTLTNFISVAGELYSPKSQYILKPFTFNPQGSLRTSPRAVPLGEILAVLASNILEPGFANLLYGISTCDRVPYTYDGQVKLPTPTFRAHTDILFLGLSFLVEVGVLEVDLGSYGDPRDLYDIDWATECTYAQKVNYLRSFEATVREHLVEHSTFYFELQPEYQESAWFALLAEVYHDLSTTGTYSPLVDIYALRDLCCTYSPDHPYYCPALGPVVGVS